MIGTLVGMMSQPRGVVLHDPCTIVRDPPLACVPVFVALIPGTVSWSTPIRMVFRPFRMKSVDIIWVMRTPPIRVMPPTVVLPHPLLAGVFQYARMLLQPLRHIWMLSHVLRIAQPLRMLG